MSTSPLASVLRRTVVPFALLLVCGRADATWSILITDIKTGEVAIGTATCITQDNLEKYVPVIRIGFGAAACQSQIDQTAKNRKIIFDQLPLGTDPDTILAMVAAQDPKIETRQIGIVDLAGRAVTFSGVQCGAWAGGVEGTQGTLTYAIQGNVLTGEPVVNAARDALLATNGDVAAKLMAAMEAARSMGGDGRCSCSSIAPTSCGSPPPSFVKSAHIGCMIIGRVGDTEGGCGSAAGCSTGVYYMNFNIKGTDGQGIDPDPVLQLKPLYDAWRSSWVGRPDHVRTEKWFSHPVLAADGVSTTDLLVRLVDWQGAPVPLEGAAIAVSPEGADNGIVTIGVPVDLGDGLYSVPLTSTTALGKQKLRVVVNDGISPVTLYPFPEVRSAPAKAIATDVTSISTGGGGDLALHLDGGPALAGRGYIVLASATGTAPGITVGGVTIPLVPDPAFAWSFALCNSPMLVNSCGTLDATGIAATDVHLPPLFLRPLHQGALTFAFITIDPIDFASNPVEIDVGP